METAIVPTMNFVQVQPHIDIIRNCVRPPYIVNTLQAHQCGINFLCFCVGADAAISERIARALAHQIVMDLHHVKFTCPNHLLNA